MKVIKFTTTEGQYGIPLELVAEDRANYYIVEVEKNIKDSNEFRQEVAWVMDDDYEGIDWLINNSDWDDWKSKAILLNQKKKTSDDDFWYSSDNFEIININW
jgi:hypothetical protein